MEGCTFYLKRKLHWMELISHKYQAPPRTMITLRNAAFTFHKGSYQKQFIFLFIKITFEVHKKCILTKVLIKQKSPLNKIKNII